FSRPVDPGTVTAANFQLVSPAGVPAPTLISFAVSADGRRVQLTYDALSDGTGYSFDLKASAIKDRAGHMLGANDIVDHFQVRAGDAWLNTATANWRIASTWRGGTVPAATDDVVMYLPAGATANYIYTYTAGQPAY